MKAAEIAKVAREARIVKNSQCAPGKAPGDLTENQSPKLAAIAVDNPKLHRAHPLEESLRIILKMTDVDVARGEPKRWIFRATHGRTERALPQTRA